MRRIAYILMMILVGCCTLSARKYEVKTGVFNKLKVPDNLNVVYVCDPERNGMAVFECADSLTSMIMFENNDKGKLIVEISPDYLGKDIDLPEIFVYSEFLTEVESSSEKRVEIRTLPRCAEFKAVLFGNGTLLLNDVDVNKLTAALMTGKGLIKMKGKADDALFKVAGAGHVDGSELPSRKVSCHVFGGGQIHCSPQDELKLKGLGSTTVYYKGNPKTVKKQGVGKLVKVD